MFGKTHLLKRQQHRESHGNVENVIRNSVFSHLHKRRLLAVVYCLWEKTMRMWYVSASVLVAISVDMIKSSSHVETTVQRSVPYICLLILMKMIYSFGNSAIANGKL